MSRVIFALFSPSIKPPVWLEIWRIGAEERVGGLPGLEPVVESEPNGARERDEGEGDDDCGGHPERDLCGGRGVPDFGEKAGKEVGTEDEEGSDKVIHDHGTDVITGLAEVIEAADGAIVVHAVGAAIDASDAATGTAEAQAATEGFSEREADG